MSRKQSAVRSARSSNAGRAARRSTSDAKVYVNTDFIQILQQLMNQNVICDFFVTGIPQPLTNGTIIDLGTNWISVKAGDEKGFIPIASIQMVRRSATTLSGARKPAAGWTPVVCSWQQLSKNLTDLGLSKDDFGFIDQYQAAKPTCLWNGAYTYRAPLSNAVIPVADVLLPESKILWKVKGAQTFGQHPTQRTSFYCIHNGSSLAKFESIPFPFEVSGDFLIKDRGVYVFVLISDGAPNSYVICETAVEAVVENPDIINPVGIINSRSDAPSGIYVPTGVAILIWYFDNTQNA
jgi:hypothetical protein